MAPVRDLYYAEDEDASSSDEEEEEVVIPIRKKEVAKLPLEMDAILDDAIPKKIEKLESVDKVVGHVGEVYCWGSAESVYEKSGNPILELKASCNGKCAAAICMNGTLCPLTAEVKQPDFKVRDLALSQDHGLAIDQEGCVWARGDNSEGQLGIKGKRFDRLEEWHKLSTFGPAQNQAVSVACGTGHSVCLTASGDLWTWGRGFEGQTGQAPIQERKHCAMRLPCIDRLPKPRLVIALAKRARGPYDPIRSIACGDDFTLALAASGKLWAFGNGKCGQLGIGHLVTCIKSPVLVNTEEKFKAVSCGSAHAIALTQHHGQVYAWGLNCYGQIGCSYKDTVFEVHCSPAPSLPDATAHELLEAEAPRTISQEVSMLSLEAPCCQAAPDFLDSEISEEDSDSCIIKYAATPRRVRGLGGPASKVDASCHGSSATRDIDGRLFYWGGSSKCWKPTPIHLDARASLLAGPFCLARCEVRQLHPPCVPQKGGSRLRMRVSGLPQLNSAQCLVQFDQGTSVIGQVASTTEIICSVPKLPKAGKYSIRLAPNGTDLSVAGAEPLIVYAEPELEALTLRTVAVDACTECEIRGTGLLETGLARVQFLSSQDDSILEVEARAVIINEEEGCYFTCVTPLFPNAGIYSLLFSLNGLDYIPVPGKLRVHDAKIKSIEPKCVPLESADRLRLLGTGFFKFEDSSIMASQFVATIAVQGIGTSTLHKKRVVPLSPVDEVAAFLDPASACRLILRSLQGSLIDEDSLNTTTVPLLDNDQQRVWTCLVNASLNAGASELPGGPLQFSMYDQPRPHELTSLYPPSAPITGGINVSLKGLHAGLYSLDCSAAKVRLKTKKMEVETALFKGEGSVFVFEVPKVSEDIFVVEEDHKKVQEVVNEDEETSHVEDVKDSVPEEMVPKRRSIALSIEVAFDGNHFSLPFDLQFYYHEAPTLKALAAEPPTLEPSSNLRIEGTAFPDDLAAAECLARLSCSQTSMDIALTPSEDRALRGTLPEDMAPLFVNEPRSTDSSEKSRHLIRIQVSFDNGYSFTCLDESAPAFYTPDYRPMPEEEALSSDDGEPEISEAKSEKDDHTDDGAAADSSDEPITVDPSSAIED